MRILNTHERRLDASPERMAALLATLGQPDDALWPRNHWPPMKFDGPLTAGLRGGHGPVRYSVEEVSPLRAVFRFTPPKNGFAAGVHGTHWFEYADGVLRHTIDASAAGVMYLKWLFVIGPMHDAVLEELLDNAARAAGVPVERPARHSPWVKILRRLGRRRRKR